MSGALPRMVRSSKPWDELTTEDLTSALARGDSVEEVAMYLRRSIAEVQKTMAELKLTECGKR